MQINDLRAVLTEVLNERSRIDPATHDRHHEYLDHRIQREEAKAARVERIKASVYGWIIISVIGGTFMSIGALVWYSIQAYLAARGLKNNGP